MRTYHVYVNGSISSVAGTFKNAMNDATIILSPKKIVEITEHELRDGKLRPRRNWELYLNGKWTMTQTHDGSDGKEIPDNWMTWWC